MSIKLSELQILLISLLMKIIFHQYVDLKYLISLSYSSTESWKNVLESKALLASNIPPYSDDSINQSPLMMHLWVLFTHIPEYLHFYMFLILDGISCFAVLDFASSLYEYFLRNQKKVKSTHNYKLLLNQDDKAKIRKIACFCYCFNPFSVVSILSKSTVILYNLLLLIFMAGLSKGRLSLASFVLALITYSDMYPVLLIPAILVQTKNKKQLVQLLSLFLLTVSFLVTISYWFYGVSYLNNVYFNNFQMEDVNPQMNIYWYLMAEMFDHFRDFFKATFQIIIFACTVGLNINLNKDPIFAAVLSHWVIVILKPYPSIGNFGIVTTMIFMFIHLMPFIKSIKITIAMIISAIFLAPLMHYLWLYSGSANANFFFAITLLFFVAQAHLLTATLQAYHNYNFRYLNGFVIPEIDEKKAHLTAI